MRTVVIHNRSPPTNPHPSSYSYPTIRQKDHFSTHGHSSVSESDTRGTEPLTRVTSCTYAHPSISAHCPAACSLQLVVSRIRRATNIASGPAARQPTPSVPHWRATRRSPPATGACTSTTSAGALESQMRCCSGCGPVGPLGITLTFWFSRHAAHVDRRRRRARLPSRSVQ